MLLTGRTRPRSFTDALGRSYGIYAAGRCVNSYEFLLDLQLCLFFDNFANDELFTFTVASIDCLILEVVILNSNFSILLT